MSRGGGDYDYDEDFNNQYAFWQHSAHLALKGKRGKKALAELREALLALPEKRLVSGAISTVALRREAEAMPDHEDFYDRGVPVPNLAKLDALAKCAAEGDGVCAVGAYLWYKRVRAGEDPQEAMAALPSLADVDGHTIQDTALAGKQAGLTYSLAGILADQNDETFRNLTPEQRYEAFLAWIDRELAS